jgi:cytochrome c oxidase subunit IV
MPDTPETESGGSTATTATTDVEPAAGPEEGAVARFEESLPAQLTQPAPGLLPGEVRKHPTPVQYVMIAVVLVVITGLEVATSYLEGDISNGIIVPLLLIMATVKFILVASWYMHLRTDRPVFRRFFILGALAAITLYLVVLLTLHAFIRV